MVVLLSPFPLISIGEDFMPQVNTTIAGIERLSRAIENFTEPLTESLVVVILPSIRMNFDAQGRPPWKKLSIGTVENRGAEGPILNRTGKLMGEAVSRGPWTITRESLTTNGPKIKYAKYHQAVTRRMPQREFMSFQPQDVEEIELIFTKWLDKKIKTESGF